MYIMYLIVCTPFIYVFNKQTGSAWDDAMKFCYGRLFFLRWICYLHKSYNWMWQYSMMNLLIIFGLFYPMFEVSNILKPFDKQP